MHVVTDTLPEAHYDRENDKRQTLFELVNQPSCSVADIVYVFSVSVFGSTVSPVVYRMFTSGPLHNAGQRSILDGQIQTKYENIDTHCIYLHSPHVGLSAAGTGKRP